jgi:4-hydroxybenzoate polyprenyltransferase
MTTSLNSLRTVLVLGRVSNLPTIWTNVAVGWFLSGGSWSGEFGWILLGMSLVYIAGMTLNDAFDEKWDKEHAATRPIPSGRIGAGSVWLLGLVEMALGIAALLLCSTAHPLLVIALVAAVFLYNWIHKRWAGAVLVMGLCRALVYLGAGSAVAAHTDSIEIPRILFLISGGVVLYIAGLTLAARSEHLATAKGPGLLPRLLLMLPVLFPLFTFRTVPDNAMTYSLVIVGVIGIWSWLVITRRALRNRVPKGIAYAIAGIAFFDAAVVSFADWRAAVLCLLLFALTLGAQRIIPAT